MAKTAPAPRTKPGTALAISLGLSEHLLAVADLDEEACVAALLAAPRLLDEAQVSLPQIRALAQRPAGEEGVKSVLAARFQIFPQPVRAEFEWVEFWTDYLAAAGDLPEAALEGAMAEWVRRPTSQFLPKPGELRDLALKTPTEAYRRYNRLQASVHTARELQVERNRSNFHLEAVRLKHIPKPPEDRAAVAAMAAEHAETTRQRIAAKRMAERVEVRPTHGTLAEGHTVTPQLLEIHRRQTDEWNAKHPSEPPRPHTYADEVRDVEARKQMAAQRDESFL